MKKRILLMLVILISGVCSQQDVNAKPAKTKYVKSKNKYNLKYSRVSKKQELDVYYPKKIKKNNDNPVVVFFHGGSYLEGNRRIHVKKNKKNFNDAGFVYVPVSYRLSGEKTYPAAIDDAKTAIRYLKHNRKKLKINSNKIIVMGFSAGANLASLTASTPNVKRFGNEKIYYSKMNNKVAGFIGVAGFYDVEELFKDFSDTSKTKKVNRKIHKYYYNQNEEIKLKNMQQGNSMRYAQTVKIPTILFHGTKDKTIDYAQTSKYCKLLRENNNKNVSCNRYEGKDHNYKNFTSKTHYNKVIKWAKKITK